jgi:hypothetical protein
MLKMVEQDESKREFIENAFDTLPTFPDHMQNSSILIKRMSEMKNKKGLVVGGKDKKDDDISSENKEEYKSAVSAALSKNKSSDASKPNPKSSDMLFSDDNNRGASQSNDEGDMLGLFDMGDTFGGGSRSNSHPFVKQNPNDFCSENTVNIDDEATVLSIDSSQDSKWKTLIPANTTDGIIYEDDEIKIVMKFKTSKYLCRVLVEYICNTRSMVSEAQAQLRVPEGMKATISPTKYPDGEHPKAMMMIMAAGGIEKELKMAVKYDIGYGDPKTVVFKVPVLINKFIDKVEMEQDRFDHLWGDISNNRPNSFEKLDLILKNPASGSDVDHMAVLKKIAKLLSV